MPITNRGELESALGTYTSRTAFAAANGPTWIALAEARINRALANIRMHRTVATLTGTIGSRNVALPSDYRHPIALFLTTFGGRTRLTPMLTGVHELSNMEGTPTAWQILGGNIELSHPCDQAHTFLFNYHAAFALGSGATDTNWLLTNHPDVYLFGCLAEGFSQMRHLEAATAYLSRMQLTLAEVAFQESRNESLAPLTIDPALVRVSGGSDVGFPVDGNELLVD
jgi:hypothetical protein